ncbi:hypothetical protein D187_010285 [Cystobacter fuscus DSM 2262]|uniref:Uncharacterized protein n=1 Tax=Cystobacter fuscus (strain ATCC 25194 / DSM 2262 / NBRC 100088 / M29) TaxID=1242864 RepID=S9PF62_CYSF2|nr:hypothetical protein D187_010285 [Cystobacter fuscus DSM 2262]
MSEGTSVSDSPPLARKRSFSRTPTSSTVSRQSATKAGHITASRLMPRAASSGSTRSVYGLTQGVRPRRDWKDTLQPSAGSPRRAANPRAVE